MSKPRQSKEDIKIETLEIILRIIKGKGKLNRQQIIDLIEFQLLICKEQKDYSGTVAPEEVNKDKLEN